MSRVSRLLTKFAARQDEPRRDQPPENFWDESTRLLALFEECRRNHQHADAAACFGRLARFRFHELRARPEYDPRIRSIVSVFQPKSGGTFLHNRILQLGYQDFWWNFPHQNCHSYCYASDEALELFLRGGCTCHSHTRPMPNILAALDRAGVERIWLHLRNPAESCASSYHHLRGEGHGGGAIGEARRREAIDTARRAGIDPQIDKSTYVAQNIDWFVEWVAEWLRFEQAHPDVVVLTFYSELDDARGMLGRVGRLTGASLRGDITAAPLPEDRFRKKPSKDWRHDLTSEARARLERAVREGLQEFDSFERLWS